MYLWQEVNNPVNLFQILIKESGIEDKVKTRTLIIPGLSAPISGEIEDECGWEVVVGPRDSSAVPDFFLKLKEKQEAK